MDGAGRLWILVTLLLTLAGAAAAAATTRRRHAYAAMMYMGTPRDYEFYVAMRVMMRSLAKLNVDADLVVIASVDVPVRWVQTFLVSYDRVVMLDSDNIFLQRTDELFQCGQFCAVFINPCIFHTGLFVLQGFLASYFPDLLGQPLFHPPTNGTKLDGTYRLPLGYQMDASYYYLKLRWSIPCGPNSVITFPSAPWLKPWYWWSWPVLPLGLSWHEQRRKNLGYGSEVPVLLIQAIMYAGIIAVTRMARPSLSKLCYNRRPEKSIMILHAMLKVAAMWSIFAAYTVPFFLIPRTVHPLLGWSLYMLGVASLSSIVINIFLLPPLPVLTVLLGILGSLLVMAFPWYSDGVVRALAVFAYAFCCAPVAWASLMKVSSSLQNLLEREAFFPRLGESTQMPEFNKLY
ncbi:hypothetical protein B296_00046394 [Ensete ventricosum]|uniref:Glucuronosyltransferase PGSIP8 n=1 Tax=Ensete ventricosum TaxID=4639 RepID=A0A426YA65_ENSVE|nr:hypothetical protein B296_00046394 [Ensete ventricosum]